MLKTKMLANNEVDEIEAPKSTIEPRMSVVLLLPQPGNSGMCPFVAEGTASVFGQSWVDNS